MSPENKIPRSHGRRKWDAVKSVLAWSGVISLVVSAVVGFVAISTARTAISNTERLDRSICAEIHYLEAVAGNPQTPMRSALALQDLIAELRQESTTCPPEPE